MDSIRYLNVPACAMPSWDRSGSGSARHIWKKMWKFRSPGDCRAMRDCGERRGRKKRWGEKGRERKRERERTVTGTVSHD